MKCPNKSREQTKIKNTFSEALLELILKEKRDFNLLFNFGFKIAHETSAIQKCLLCSKSKLISILVQKQF